MNNKLYIQDYCKIKNSEVILNKELLFKADSTDLKAFLKEAYRGLSIKYAKFFKMDSLSKLAFIGAELLLKEDVDSKTGIVFSNKASSLDTDRKHQESIDDQENYFPSPAVFVYTLPNIGMGEISIRHQLKSENAFFIFDQYNAGFHKNYEQSLIAMNKCESVLAGWVNVDKGNYDLFLYVVSKTGSIEHTKENLIKLYNN